MHRYGIQTDRPPPHGLISPRRRGLRRDTRRVPQFTEMLIIL
ncbi:hypothetical protein ETAE_0661 [Edwardsiella piscicida]|uniref:Uncharacterized protein n=1 Tax=Edwardsiella piscicida TaxID=1263550 RepID=A0AAU8P520_EDWPI|nr:hypothetical protein ETAE_0661 [Edwardsiella tarda EIB202]